MKQRKPIERKTPLKRSNKPLKRTEIKRSSKPIAQRGKKTKREADAWEQCKQQVRARSGGWCELESPWCPPRDHRATQVHHVWPEDRDAGRHDAARCLDACGIGHRGVHEHPAEAATLGLLRPKD